MYRTKLKNNLQISTDQRAVWQTYDVLAYFLYIYINTEVVAIIRNELS